MRHNHFSLLPEQAFKPRPFGGMTLEGGGGIPIVSDVVDFAGDVFEGVGDVISDAGSWIDDNIIQPVVDHPLETAALVATAFVAPEFLAAEGLAGEAGAALATEAGGMAGAEGLIGAGDIFGLGGAADAFGAAGAETLGSEALADSFWNTFLNQAPISDISVPFDPAAYGAISTGQGLTDLASALSETVLSNPLKALQIANLLGGLTSSGLSGLQSGLRYLPSYGGSGTGGTGTSGIGTGLGSGTSFADLSKAAMESVSPPGGAGRSALPGSLSATFLPAGGAAQQSNFLSSLQQLSPQLAGVDSRLLSTITHRAAKGGHIPEFVTGATGHYVQGRGDGQSDDIPAMLADGEYVFDADTVAALGNGSNKAGAAVLDQMRENIRKHKRSASVDKIPPKSKSPLEYLKG